MRYRAICFALLSCLAAAWIGLPQPARAQPSLREPGSVLIFPMVDSGRGAVTAIQITNTNRSGQYCPSTDTRAGQVVIHYEYVDPMNEYHFDRFEFLDAGDSLIVLADEHAPETTRGFVVVTALSPFDLEPFDFDYLIGSAHVAQSGLNRVWRYSPYGFRAVPESTDPCNRVHPDALADGDGALDFDDVEYDRFPAELVADSFFEQNDRFGSQLVLMSLAPEDLTSAVKFLFWNNVEQKFSRSFNFICWWNGALSEISAIAEGLGGDGEELGVDGVETGWVSFTPNRLVDGSGNPVGTVVPPILGVFGQFITGQDFATGHALHYSGTIDGLELKGDADHLP